MDKLQTVLETRQKFVNAYKESLIISIDGSRGKIHCAKEYFKELILEHSVKLVNDGTNKYPIRASIIIQEIEFFTLWEEEEFKETFPKLISQVVRKETV
ncbi:hypothetical protein [Clostridium formicaceticum]|uniref:Uncharacterized protein n=1 Tax=Clostridium formicaceticum TaxID=1497 RepID=A0AAC9WGW8_9CLOT|nr:hypothetical protein [Clostridium formicaceticum]AOY76664.1 hypothetical protein BJL90_12785 [Clostridium formicaceticum]ARE87090.1 hypothetical protein CLFO_14760 [Clostridium formicaceticum]